MTYYIYILANKSRVLYVGVTNNLERRMYEHKEKLIKGFTEKYRINRLVHYEEFKNIIEAIEREKQLKNWRRQWKIELIEEDNPEWKDISLGW